MNVAKLRRFIARFAGVELIVGGAIFMVATSFFSYAIGYSYLKQWRASREFVPVEAVGVDARVDSRSGGKGSTTYSPEITYRYTVRGTTHESTRYFYSGSGASDYDEARAIADRYPPGAQFAAYYDPKEPSHSVLDPTPPPLLLPSLVVLAFWAFGALFLFVSTQSIRKRRAHDSLKETPHVEVF